MSPAALLRQAGVDATTVGAPFWENRSKRHAHPIWTIVTNEMPTFDTRAPWEDVFDFRAEDRSQHLVRSLRRWIRKVVAEDWTETELQDEVRELNYEYETHLRLAGVHGGKGIMTCVITGVTELTEAAIKLRLAKIAELVSAFIDRRARLLEAESQAPGRELAIIPKLRNRFI